MKRRCIAQAHHMWANPEAHRHTDTQTHRHTSTQAHRYTQTYTDIHRHTCTNFGRSSKTYGCQLAVLVQSHPCAMQRRHQCLNHHCVHARPVLHCPFLFAFRASLWSLRRAGVRASHFGRAMHACARRAAPALRRGHSVLWRWYRTKRLCLQFPYCWPWLIDLKPPASLRSSSPPSCSRWRLHSMLIRHCSAHSPARRCWQCPLQHPRGKTG